MQPTILFNGTGMVAGERSLWDFQDGARIPAGKAALRDFDFHKPDLTLHAETQADWDFLEIYRFPGYFHDQGTGQAKAKRQWEAQQCERHVGRGIGNVPRLAPGLRFELSEHPRAAFNRGYLILEVNHAAEQPQVLRGLNTSQAARYQNHVVTLPADVPFRRSALPKPALRGVQTALVTGPAGEEIYVNEHGQIKVQFHWDREGRYDEHSSCWIRVSQPSAGAGWGGVYTPRIGTEVIVRHRHGDPDQPICVGQVYNGTHRLPYALPEEKTKSTLKSNSSPANPMRGQAPGGAGFNELRFEDRQDKEQLLIHGEKDWDLRVKHDRREWVGHQRHLIVVDDHHEHTQGDQHRTVTGDHNEKVTGSAHQATQHRQDQVGGRYAHEAGQEIHLKAGTKVVIDAGQELTLQAGAGFVKLDVGGVSVAGSLLRLNEGGAALAGSGARVKVPVKALEAAMAKAAAKLQGKPAQSKAYEPPERPSLTVVPTETSEHWVEIVLQDAAGHPLPNEAFALLLPNGLSRMDSTDAQGRFRVERLPQGGQADIKLMNRLQVLPGGRPDPAEPPGPQPKPKQLSRLRWVQERVKVGTPATLEFYYQGFDGGEAVTVTIFEYNPNGKHEKMDQIKGAIPTQAGVNRVDWVCSIDKMEQAIAHELDAGEDDPLEFIFAIQVGDIKLQAESKLALVAPLRLELTGPDGESLPDGTRICVTAADKQEYIVTMQGGTGSIDAVIAGPVKISPLGE